MMGGWQGCQLWAGQWALLLGRVCWGPDAQRVGCLAGSHLTPSHEGCCDPHESGLMRLGNPEDTGFQQLYRAS